MYIYLLGNFIYKDLLDNCLEKLKIACSMSNTQNFLNDHRAMNNEIF